MISRDSLRCSSRYVPIAEQHRRGERHHTLMAAPPLAVWRGASSPNDSNIISARPSTARYTPMSNTSRRRHLHRAEQRQVERERPALQHLAAEQQRDEGGGDGDQQPGAEHDPRPAAGEPADLADAPGDVAQRHGGAGHDAADEAAARLVVAGEEQPQRADHDGGEDDAHGDVDRDEALHGDRRERSARSRPGRRPARARATVPMAAAVSTVSSPSGVHATDVDEDDVDDVASVALRDGLLDHRVGDVRRRVERRRRRA